MKPVCTPLLGACVVLAELMLPAAAAGQAPWAVGVVSEGTSSTRPFNLSRPALVTAEPSRTNEISNILCVDPSNPRRLFGAVAVDGAPQEVAVRFEGGETAVPVHQEVYFSADGGATWSLVFQTQRAGWEADPSCAYGTDGSAYLGVMPLDPDGHFRNYDVYRSEDGGRTWDPEPHRIAYPRFFDRAFMAVDHTSTEARGRLYITGYAKTLPYHTLQAPDQMIVFTSDDSGRNFRLRAQIPDGCEYGGSRICFNHPGPSALMRDGTLLVAWSKLFESNERNPVVPPTSDELPGNLGIGVARMTANTDYFESSVTINQGARWKPAGNTARLIVGKWVPALAVDTSTGQFEDRVYVAWSDVRTRNKRIYVSYSTDRGTTFSDPRAIPFDMDVVDNQVGPNDFTLTLAVNRDGVVGLLFYRKRSYSENPEAMFTVSRDGGETWSTPERVLDPRSPELVVADADARRHSGMPYNEFRSGRSPMIPTCAHGLTVDSDGRFNIIAYDYSAGYSRLFYISAEVDENIQ